MKKIDAINNQSPNSPVKKKAQNNVQKKSRSKNYSQSRQKQSRKAWFFSFLAIILVIILWLFGLRENWERINQKQRASNEDEINSLKIKFNKLFGNTSELLNNLDTFENKATNTTTTSSDFIENQPINNSPTLTDVQIKEITKTLKQKNTENNESQ